MSPASSWLAAAFCWTTSSSWLTPTLISRIAAICSWDAAAISWIRFDVSRIIGTVRSSSVPAFSATATLFLARSLICWAAAWLRSASLRTSPATTANPLPWVPGAGRLDRCVQRQQVRLIGDVLDDQIFWVISRMAATVSWTASPPFSAWVLASLAVRAVSLACWAFRPTEASTDLQAAGDFLQRGRLLGRALSELLGAGLSSLLAVETEEVTAADLTDHLGELVDDRIYLSSPGRRARPSVDVRAVVEVPLLKVFG